MAIRKIKGTSDLIFETMNRWKIVEQKLKNFLEISNFQEIQTPILEYKEIFHRSSEFSEMTLKETFQFLDKKGRLIVLRPEITASIARSYIENKYDQTNQLYKFYYSGPCFRYERPQKGRYRQFHQIGIEMFNMKHNLAEIEILVLVQDMLKLLYLDQAKIKINHLGDVTTRHRFLTNFIPYLEKNKKYLCDLCLQRQKQNILRIFDCKKCANKDFLKKSPLISDYLTPLEKNKFYEILNILQKLQVNFEIDHKLVRGLDYYTDIVFEITFCSSKNQKDLVLGGGGCYNDLISNFGGQPTNSIGFAFGMERLILALEENNFFSSQKTINLDIYILNLQSQNFIYSFSLLRKLRHHAFRSEMNYEIHRHFKHNLKKALQYEPKYIIFLGAKEIQTETFTIKNTKHHTEYTVDASDIIHFFEKNL